VVIKLNFAGLKRTQWHEYLARFVLGGLITALTGWLASRWGPIFGGLFLAFPAIFPASATLLEKHERDKKHEAGIAFTIRGRLAAALDARGALMGALGGVAFAVVTWKCLLRGGVFTTLVLALGSWLAVSSTLWYVRKHHPWARRRVSGA
jgi:hypothetical protein